MNEEQEREQGEGIVALHLTEYEEYVLRMVIKREISDCERHGLTNSKWFTGCLKIERQLDAKETDKHLMDSLEAAML